MDIGNKIPAPSLCLLALLPKAITALLTTALCGSSCVTSMDCLCCAVGAGSAGVQCGPRAGGSTAPAVSGHRVIVPVSDFGTDGGENELTWELWLGLSLYIVSLTLVVALFF